MDVLKHLDCAHVEENDLVSRYLGHKLSPEEAEAFEEHYFACDGCWAEVQAATALRAALGAHGAGTKEMAPAPARSRVIRGPWTSPALLAAVAAAVAIVAVATVLLVSKRASRSADPTSLVADLAQAVGQRHSIRARLTGGFRYPEVSRSAGTPAKTTSWKVFAQAEKIKQAAEHNASADAARALGLAHLFVGEVDQAVGRLEEGALLAPKNAHIHSDLSAAYLVLGEQKDRPDAFVRALSEAETAIGIDPNLAEAHFNRALALESLSLKDKARKAWEDYLRLDSRSEWAGEARRHLEALSAPRTSRSWEEEEKRLDKAIERGDSDVIQEVLKEFPQQSRENFEQEVLPRWAEQVVRGVSESRAKLQGLELFAQEQSRASGDRMLADVMTAVSRIVGSADPQAMARLARGLTDYSRGKDLLDRLESQKAQIEFGQARVDLAQSANPLSCWADFYRAICLYYKEDFEDSWSECERLRVLAQTQRYENLLGRSLWLGGLIQLLRGQVDRGVKDFSSALICFGSTGELGHAAAVHSLLAGALAYLGESRASWNHRLASLRALENLDDPRRAHRLYSDAAVAAVGAGFPRVGLAFQDCAIATAGAWNSSIVFTEAYLYRSFILRKLGSDREARDELGRAQVWLERVQDAALKRGESAEVSAALGELEIARRPDQAQKMLTGSLEYFRATKQRMRLSELYLDRGRAFLNANDLGRAERDFQAGLKEFEAERQLQGDFRISFFERSWKLFDEALRLAAIQRGHPERALAYLERLHGRDLLMVENAASTSAQPDREIRDQRPLNPDEIRPQLPRSTGLLYFAALDDRLLSWLATRDGLHFADTAISASELTRRIGIYRRMLEREAPPVELNRWASSLHEDLIRPHAQLLRSISTLIVIPDGALHELPFASLLDRKTGRYLIQDYSIGVAPSGTIFLAASNRLAQAPRMGIPSVLVVGAPKVDAQDFPGLSPLPHAAAEARNVAEIYPQAELLVGRSATRRGLLEAAERHEILHFAGHALANEEYPGLSRLVLTPENAEDSGSLFASDISRRRFARLQLVILSSCRSAEGLGTRGEGPMSLARAFLASQVPGAVATLWDVDDRTASLFFAQFHKALRNGHTSLAALREAQLHSLFARDESLRSPARWAPFELIGSGEPIQRRI